jgi:hypothetical protein
MPEKEFEVPRPRTFVNEASEPGKGKQKINENVHVE